jgi:hypothetical protein
MKSNHRFNTPYKTFFKPLGQSSTMPGSGEQTLREERRGSDERGDF